MLVRIASLRQFQQVLTTKVLTDQQEKLSLHNPSYTLLSGAMKFPCILILTGASYLSEKEWLQQKTFICQENNLN